MRYYQQAQIDNSKTISFSIFIRQLFRGWYWFLGAIILFLIISFYYSSRLNLGTSKYKMGVMSRFGEVGSVIQEGNNENDFLWSRKSPFSTDNIYGFLISSSLIHDAGKSVGFDVDYIQSNGSRRYDVYNDLPYHFLFLDLEDNDVLTLDALWQGKSVAISNLRGTFKGGAVDSYSGFSSEIALGDTLKNTPIGRIVCVENSANDRFPRTSLDLSLPVSVRKIETDRATTLYDKDIDLDLQPDQRVLVLEMAVTGSQRRVVEVMTAMVTECEKRIRKEMLADCVENESLLKKSLAKLDTLPMPALNKNKERDVILDKLARNESNKNAIEMGNILTITDTPSARPATSANQYFKIILFILLMAGALLGVYLTKILPNVIFEKKQLSKILYRSLLETITFHSKWKKGREERSLLCLDTTRMAFEGTKQLFVVDMGVPKITQWLSSCLASNLIRSGKKVFRLHYALEGEKSPKGCHTIMVKAGYIGGDLFWNDLATLQETNRGNLPIIITASPSLQKSLIPLFVDLLFVVVGEKTPLCKVEEYSSMLPTCDKDKHLLHYATIWVKLPLL